MYRMVQKWFTEFRCGFTSTETIPSSGPPNVITTPEMINKINYIILNDPKMEVREIAEIVSISTEPVVNIFHTHFELFGRHRKVERSLDLLYRAKRKVY